MTRAPLDFAPDDERNDPAPRPFNWRLIIALFAIEAIAVGVFVWVVMS